MEKTELDHVVNLNITDQLMSLTSKTFFQRFAEYAVNIRSFLENSRINGERPVQTWIADLLDHGGIGTLALQGCDPVSQWFPCMNQLMNIFPTYCSLCEQPWVLTEPLKTIVQYLEKKEDPKVRMFLTQAQMEDLGLCHGSGAMDVDKDDAADRVSLLTAPAAASEAASVSLLTAPADSSEATGGVSLLTAPADAQHSSGVSVLTSGDGAGKRNAEEGGVG